MGVLYELYTIPVSQECYSDTTSSVPPYLCSPACSTLHLKLPSVIPRPLIFLPCIYFVFYYYSFNNFILVLVIYTASQLSHDVLMLPFLPHFVNYFLPKTNLCCLDIPGCVCVCLLGTADLLGATLRKE